jgi:ubiquitin carboxyl-terminal hydrolase 2/21
MRLDDCLRLFVEEEVIDGSEKPMCSKCKGRNVFTKRFTIERLPKILVIHLKRFLFSPYSYKISTDVSYPIEGLDVSKYLSSVVDPSSTPSASATSRKNTNCIYDLYAISLHSGSSQSSGHYYAYGKHPFSNKWHCFNDSM